MAASAHFLLGWLPLWHRGRIREQISTIFTLQERHRAGNLPLLFVAVQLLRCVQLFLTHGLQHTRPHCPSASPNVCPSSCPWHQFSLHHFDYFIVNLRALVCLETNEPPDPDALISHWGSLGKLAVPWILLGGGRSALEHSRGHYGAGTKQARAWADIWGRPAPAPLSSLASTLGISARSLLRVYTRDSMSRAKWLMDKACSWWQYVTPYTWAEPSTTKPEAMNNAATSGINFRLGEAGTSRIYELNLWNPFIAKCG